MTFSTQRLSNRKRRGIALIWVALTFLIIFAILGLMLDWARVYITGHQLQNAADSAALAGARYVSVLNDPTVEGYRNARTVAQEYATANLAAKVTVNVLRNDDNSDGGIGDDIVIGRYVNPNETYPDGLFIPNDPFPDAMKVVARKDGNSNERLALLFGPLFGVTERDNIQKYAIAKIYDPYGAGLIALGEYTDVPGVTFTGVGSEIPLSVLNGGSVQVNSHYVGDNDAALSVNSKNIEIGADRILIAGGYNDKFEPSEATDIYDNLGADGVVPDPYGAVDEPALYSPISPTAPADGSPLTITQGIHTLQPGYYPGGFDFSGGNVTLQPGVYQLGGEGLDVTGNTSMTATETMFHVVDTGNVDLGGGGGPQPAISITAPTSGPYEGIAIFQSRDPDGDGDALNNPESEINGNNNLNIDGVVYMPKNLLSLSGTGDGFGTRAIADRFEIAGNAQVVIDYKGIPNIAKKSYLVE
jgi:hypothetical protein